MAQIVIDSNSNLIQGDFDSATVNNRTKFQTSTVNANTGVYAVPNGTGTVAGFQAANNSNPTNASKIVMATNGSTDTQIISGVNGSGTYLPLSFYTNNTLAGQFDTSGNLTVTGGITVGATAAPAFSAYANANISMANNTATKILFQTEEFDTNSNFASSTFTPTVAGYYQINAAISFGGWTSTYLFTIIYKNGSEYKRGSSTANNASGLNGVVSSIVYFNGSTDYVEIYGQHNNGSAQSTSAFGVSAVWFNGSFVRSA